MGRRQYGSRESPLLHEIALLVGEVHLDHAGPSLCECHLHDIDSLAVGIAPLQ
jgi:hypothetical protein